MLLRRSKLDVREIDRPRVIELWLILVLISLLTMILILLYPYKTLVERVLGVARNDALTISYLRNLSRTDPDNPRLRLVLSKQQFAARQFDIARFTLKPLLRHLDPPIRADAMWLDLNISERELFELPEGSAQRAKQLRDIKHKLYLLEQNEENAASRVELARKALVYGEQKLALTILENLVDGSQLTDLFADAAQTALANGEYVAAAKFYIKARSNALTVGEKRKYFFAAIRTLQSGDMSRQALVLAETELKELHNDQEALIVIIELARATNQAEVADKYARMLLRLSLLGQWCKALMATSSAAFYPCAATFVHTALDVTTSAEKQGPELPFDDRIYTLGYQVFIGNRKLEDAYLVATAAVRQRPDNLDWRMRLAQAAEWTGRPAIALEHWLLLARRRGTEEDWNGVLRLAPGLFNDEALLLALQHKLSTNRTDARLIKEIVALYERLGQPREGLAFLKRAGGNAPSIPLLEESALLTQRVGDNDKAILLWEQLIRQDGVTVPRAIQLATLYLLYGRTRDAYHLLNRAKEFAVDKDSIFWRFYATVANTLQESEAAKNAYEKIIHADKDATEADYDFLIGLLRDEYPLEAARIAETAWRQYKKPYLLLASLTLLSSQAQWQEMKRLFDEIEREGINTWRNDIDFYRLRAQYYQSMGKLSLAIRDLKTAIKIQPDSPPIYQTLIWLMIDANDSVNLRAWLTQYEKIWSNDLSLHDALAGAHLALSEPAIALRYLSPRVDEHRDDFLWLMNYADALEQNAETDRAWRLREQLWRNRAWQAPEGRHAVGQKELAAARRIARIRLGITRRSGDEPIALLTELLRTDQKDQAGHLSPQAREIVLAWWQDAGQYEAQRGFLWQQYARNMAKPLWAEITIALATHDTARVGELLDHYGDRLPRYDRVNAARQINDMPLMASLAFETQVNQPHDDETHQQLTEVLINEAHSAKIDIAGKKIGAIDEVAKNAHIDLRVWPRIRFHANAAQIDRDGKDDKIINNVPSTETIVLADVEWKQNDGETRFGVGQRNSFDSSRFFEIEQQANLTRRLSASLKFAKNITAPESLFTRVAGMRNQNLLRFDYRLSRYDRFTTQLSHYKYLTQSGLSLGRGHEKNIEYVHDLRSELRDLQFSLFFSDYRFKLFGDPFSNTGMRRYGTLLPRLAQLPLANPVLSQQDRQALETSLVSLLPSSFHAYGIRLSSDLRLQTDYTRGWHPFGSIGLVRNSVSGIGYDFLFGIAGSIWGSDHFQITQQFEKGGSVNLGKTQQFDLTYQVLF